MLTFAALALLQANSPAAAPAPTFCERMARTWNMGHYAEENGRVYFAKLKGGWRGHTLIVTSYSGQVPACEQSRRALSCEFLGPGLLTVGSDRFKREFGIESGEAAIVDTNGKVINCQDRKTSSVN